MSDPRAILEQAGTIAVVGASANPSKVAYAIPAGLQSAGYRVIPVNPNADEIHGEKVYARLEDVPEPVDVVNVFRPAEEAPAVVRSASTIGARAVWLQKGLISEEARRLAASAGIAYIEDLCMGVERARYGIIKHTA